MTSARSSLPPGSAEKSSSVLHEQVAVLPEGVEQGRARNDLVEPRGALERRDLSHQGLRVLRGGHAIDHQAFARGRQVAHLDGRADRAEQRGQGDDHEPEQDQAGEGAGAEGGSVSWRSAGKGT